MQSGLVWIVQTPLQKISGLRNNPGQNISGKIISPQNLFSKKIHHRAFGGKGNDNQVRGYAAVGSDPVKLIRLMESDISLFQCVNRIPGADGDFPFVYTDKFPEIMRFPGKREGTHILKIVQRKDLIDMQFLAKRNSFVSHSTVPLSGS